MTESTSPVLQPDPWHQAWSGLRARRAGALASALGLLVLLAEPTGVGIVIGTLVVLRALLALRTWPCPRCQESFAGARGPWMPDRCATCDLPAFAAPELILAAPTTRRANARTLAPRFRRMLAVSQISGGVLVASLGLMSGVPFPSRELIDALAFLSVLAGVWLWRDDPRGYRYSRALHALQLVKIQSAWVIYAVSAGFQILVWRTSTAVGLSPGVYGTVSVTRGNDGARTVAVNAFSLVALILLLHARPPASQNTPSDA